MVYFSRTKAAAILLTMFVLCGFTVPNFFSEETVKSHVRHLLAKLQARSRAHAVAVGFRRSLIG